MTAEQQVVAPTVTVHIEDVPLHSITDALLAIEAAAMRGMWDQQQHDRLAQLVLGLRKIRDGALDPWPSPLGQAWTSRMCEREYHTLCKSERCACSCHPAQAREKVPDV